MTKDLIAILAGGWSGEREVSLSGGRQCAQALERAGHKVVLIDPAREMGRLFELTPQIKTTLILLHGAYGEDGRIQGLLECLGLPYQGAGVAASVLAINKVLAKDYYRRAGLKMARDVVLWAGEVFDAQEILDRLNGSAVVKPAREGSSLGMAMVERPEDLAPALEKAFELDNCVLIEERLRGREISGSVLERLDGELEALPIVEIRPKTSDFFDYQAKYTAGASEEICPAPLEADVTAKAQAVSLTAHRALGLEHWSRTDMFVVDGEIYVLETNTIPGMSPTSLVPQSAAAAGIDLASLLERLVDLAVRDRG